MQCRSPYNRNVKAHCISQSGLSSEKTLAVVWLTNVVVISQRSILAFFLLTFLINLDFLSFSISFLSTDFLLTFFLLPFNVGFLLAFFLLTLNRDFWLRIINYVTILSPVVILTGAYCF